MFAGTPLAAPNLQPSRAGVPPLMRSARCGYTIIVGQEYARDAGLGYHAYCFERTLQERRARGANGVMSGPTTEDDLNDTSDRHA